MRQVEIKSMELHYFKGTTNAKINFFSPVTIIEGPNGCGKSTIMDAFFWCLWGKNAAGRTDFAVKTNDKDGHEIPHVEHSVSITLMVNCERQTFERTLTPKYDKEGNLKGNTTTYVWNQVPCKMSEYNAKVAAVIDESTFNLIASPTAFISQDWKKQRKMLIRMAGEVDDEEVAQQLDGGGTGDCHDLLEQLTGKTLVEYRRELDSKIKRIDEQMQGIPDRIDEVTRNTPETPNMEAIRNERQQLKERMDSIEEQERDDSKAYAARNAERREVTKQLDDLKQQRFQLINDEEAKQRNAIHEANQTYIKAEAEYKMLKTEQDNDLHTTNSRQQSIQRSIDSNRQQSDVLSKDIDELRSKWTKENGQKFDASQFLSCPLFGHQCTDLTACGRYDQDQQGAYQKFCETKKSKLDGINAEGKKMGDQLQQLLATIDSQLEELNAINTEIGGAMQKRRDRMAELEKIMQDNPKRPLIANVDPKTVPGVPELDQRIVELQRKLDGMKTYEPATADHSGEKETIRRRQGELDVEEAKLDTISKASKRIEELQEELKKLGSEKAKLEQKRYILNSFEIARANAVSERVNALFHICKWQMFERMVNGEEVPACICMVDGVPYASANKASQVNAGIDIASTLASSMKSFSPLFIDNAESVTNIYTPAKLPIQQIRLKVGGEKMTVTK